VWRFIRTTVAGAILLVLPATVLTIIFNITRASFIFVRGQITPLAALSPIQSVGGVGVAALLAVALLVLLSYLTGLVIRTALVRRMAARCDARLLGSVPLYGFLRSLFLEMFGRPVDAGMDYALAWISESWQPAVVIEELHHGWLAVFVPMVPSPFSGALHFLPPDRVKRINATSAETLAAMARYGVGFRAILKDQL
jgi:uncharacterized membrane protein